METMTNLFNDFNLAVNDFDKAKKMIELSAKTIVMELQKENGFVEFDENTSYPYFMDDSIGRDAIVAVKCEDGKIKLLTESQGCNTIDENSEWFDWYLYGELDFVELVSVLKRVADSK